MTYYDILGIKPTATDDEIKTAYRKAAKKYHPDMKGGDAKKFIEVQHAYEQIMAGKGQRAPHNANTENPFSGSGFDPNNPFSDWFRQKAEEEAKRAYKKGNYYWYSSEAPKARAKPPVSGKKIRELLTYDVEHRTGVLSMFSWECDGCHDTQKPDTNIYYFAQGEKKLCKQCKSDIADWFKDNNNFAKDRSGWDPFDF